jgi:hypothetical protein
MLNTKRPHNNPLHYSESSGCPHERINIDTLTTTPIDNDGYSMILVIVDCFTRWVELYPLKTLCAKEAGKCIIDYVTRFGSPRYILSDNATQFINETLKYLAGYEGFNHYTITPYSHEENGMVERQNKEVLRHLRAYVFDARMAKQWSTIVPFVRYIMNNTANRVTQYTPSYLLFGPALNPNRYTLENKPTPVHYEGCPIDWIKTQAELQGIALDIAETLQHEHNEAHDKSNTQPTIFPVKSIVLLDAANNKTGPGRKNKLHMPKRGPYEVEYIVGNDYHIRHLSSNHEMIAHCDRLSQFICPPYTTATEEANKDTQAFEVSEVKSARTTGPSNTWEFRVKFKGSDDIDILSWADARGLEACHEYLRKTKRAKLIPAKYIPDDNPTTSSTLVGPHRKPSTTLISSTSSTRVLREAAANGALIDSTELPTPNTDPVPECTEHDTEAIPNPPDTRTNTVSKKKRKRNKQATYQNDE